MSNRVIAIVQARMQSTRLPGKVMKEVLGKPLLGYLIERLSMAQHLDDIVIATSNQGADDVIAKYCAANHVKCYRGSEDDVLLRYFEAAVVMHAEVVIRICSDSPLIDSVIIDEMIVDFQREYPRYDYLSNTIHQTYPMGMNAEVFSIAALREAHLHGKMPYEREHVTPYIYEHPDLFSIGQKHISTSLAKMRLTVDVPEDFELIRQVLETIYPLIPNFSLSDIVALFKRQPNLLDINSHVIQKQLNRSSLSQTDIHRKDLV